MTEAAPDPDDGTIARIVAAAPPLTTETRERLARLFRHGTNLAQEGSTS